MNATAYDPGIQGGRREDLRNVLTILEPEETPFTSMVRKGPAPKSTYIETLGDNLRKPRTSGTKEGTDAQRGGNKAVNRQRFGTFIHRSMDQFGVTDVQQIISERGGQAAVDDEYGFSKAKTVRELKRDIEAVNLGGQDHQGGDDVAMTTRGAYMWTQAAAQPNNPVPALFRTLPGAILASDGGTVPLFTEDQLNGILKTLKGVYGGKRTYQLIGGNNVIDTVDHFTRIDNYQGRYKVLEDATENEITMMVNVFDTSFGRVEMHPSDFSNVDVNGNPDPNAGLILNMELWHMDLFDELHAMDLPDLGGGPNGYAKTMWALLCDSPRGNGKITDAAQ
jgi:hypothetical protein